MIIKLLDELDYRLRRWQGHNLYAVLFDGTRTTYYRNRKPCKPNSLLVLMAWELETKGKPGGLWVWAKR